MTEKKLLSDEEIHTLYMDELERAVAVLNPLIGALDEAGIGKAFPPKVRAVVALHALTLVGCSIAINSDVPFDTIQATMAETLEQFSDDAAPVTDGT